MTHRFFRVWVAAGVMALVGAGACGNAVDVHAQRGSTQQPPPVADGSADVPGMPASSMPGPVMMGRMDEERRKAANEDRYKRLASDVDKLVALTNELKSDVDKTNKDELSLDVIKKAQEIEKLAHDVQSRMKN